MTGGLYGNRRMVHPGRLAAGTPSSTSLLSGDQTWKDMWSINTTVPSGNTVANASGSDVAFSSSYTIAANTLKVGTIIRIKLYGVYGTTLLSPNLTGKLKIGSSTLLSTGALTIGVSLTNAGWSAEALLSVTAVGSGGAVEAQGFAQFATAATTGLSVNLTNTSTIAVNTTVSQTIAATVQWSASSSSNTITLRQALFEVLSGVSA